MTLRTVPKMILFLATFNAIVYSQEYHPIIPPTSVETDDYDNVALSSRGATAVAISEGKYLGKTRHAWMAIDGDSSSFWASQWNMPAWLEVELAEVHTIGMVGVWWGSHQHEFSISLSEDGVNWSTVVPTRLSSNSEGSAPTHELFLIPTTRTKYIRIDITSTSAPSSHIFQAIVQELEAYPIYQWEDGFESYKVGSFPAPTWTPDANANESYIDSTISFEGEKSLRHHGAIRACWGALAYRPITISPPYEIEVSVRNGNESLSGCHPDRAYIGIRKGFSWTNAGRQLIQFNGDSTIVSSQKTLGTYTPLAWYTVKIRYERPSSSEVKLSYWIDDTYLGSETLQARSEEDELTNLDLTVQEGTAWFDAVKVLPVVKPAPCSITALAAAGQTDCNPQTNTYNQDVTITYSNPPDSGTLDVNGQSFPITASPQTVTLEGLEANGESVDVTATFSDQPSCSFTENALFTAPSTCSNPPVDMLDGLISYYKLDEVTGIHAEDSHGTNHGTANDARVFTTEIQGVINTGADFTNGDDGIATAIEPFGLTLPFSVSLWFKINSFTGHGVVTALYAGKPPFDDREKINMRIEDAEKRIHVTAIDVLNGRKRKTVISSIINTNDWIHLVVVADGTNLRLYINNNLEDTEPFTTLTSGERPFGIGFRAESNDRHMDGAVDEVGIWRRALTTQEVSKLHNNGNGLQYPFTQAPPCSITALTAVGEPRCDPLTNSYSQDLTVTFSNPPASGALDINGQSFPISGSPQTVTLKGLEANGEPVDVTATFSDHAGCTLTHDSLFTAPLRCTSEALIWKDGFESYKVGSFPSQTWTPDANAKQSYIDSTVSFEGTKSLRHYGVVNGCQTALAYRTLTVSPPYEIEVAVRNGNELLSGCHPKRASIRIRKGLHFGNPARMFIEFRKDNTILSSSGKILQTYSPLNWYLVRIRYERPSASKVKLSYWINDTYLGTETLQAHSEEDNMTNLDLSAHEGTAWFDAVKINSVIPPIMDISPQTLNFGIINFDQTRDSTITISNSASSSISLLSGNVSINGSGFEIVSGNGPFSLSPGQSHSVTVRFSPTAEQDYSGSLNISHDAGNTSNPLMIPLSGSGVAASPNVGLVAYYPFDGNANDESGNGNHGAVIGATLTTDRFGNANSAYFFDGQTSYIEVPDSPSLDIIGPISLAVWVKADFLQYFRVGLIDKRPPTEPSGGYDLILGDAGQGSFAEFDLVVSNTPLPSILGGIKSNTYLNDNNWHHIAATYDGQTMKMYVDAQLENSFDYSAGYVENDVPLLIGKFDYGYDDGHGNKPNILNGVMDDVYVYNRALSTEEIEALYEKEAPPRVYDYVFLAERDVVVSNHVDSEGDIHSNNRIKLAKSGGNSEHTGNVSAVNKIEVQKSNNVDGIVTAPKVEVHKYASVTNIVIGNVIPLSLPTISFSAGGPDVKVGKNDVQSLAPGSYGRVKVRKNGRLQLSSGDYFFEKFKTGKFAMIEIDVSGGPVAVNVEGRITIGKAAAVMITPRSEAVSKQVTFNSIHKSVKIKHGAHVLGTIIAPKAKVELGKQARFKGTICAKSIKVAKGVAYLHHSSPTSLPKVGFMDDFESTAEELAPSSVPSQFQLGQNYPNPFNPSTAISYSLPKAANINLSIYNLRGQLVRRLVSGAAPAGHHKVLWDGKNENGVQVTSGIYVYRLEAKDFVAAKKLLLAK